MTTVVNNPADGTDNGGSSMGVGMIVGIIVVIALIVLFFMFFFRGAGNTTAPTTNEGGTGVEIPSQVDVNVDGLPNGNGGQ